MRLLTAAGAGNGASQEIAQWGNREIDQFRTVFIFGTVGGATVTLEISPNNVNWFPTGVTTTTGPFVQNVEFRAKFVRGVVAGGAGPAVDMILL